MNRSIAAAAAVCFSALALVGSPRASFADETARPERESTASPIGRKIEDFQLSDFRGREWSLSQLHDKKVVVVLFLGTECPLVRLYAPKLVKLSKEYAERGAALIAVNSNCQDSITEMDHFARVHKVDFPLLKDPGNVVADRFAAQRTPEVFVLDAQRKVRYHGRIDDQYTYGVQRPAVTQDYLAAAVEALLADEEVETKETEVVGCHIGRVLEADESSEVTYANQISRIFQKHCVECHREGQIAPFQLTDYDEVVGWAEMIDEVVRQQRMPPWHANPKYGEFWNDTRLSDEEKELIYRWVKAGAPRGDVSQLPRPREFTPGWRIGEPDQIVYMDDKPFDVPPAGEVKYQHFFVNPGWKEDRWIKAAECRPGNHAVVHHIVVASRGPGGSDTAHGLKSDWIAAMAPGSVPLILEPGYAKFVPAGSTLVFQLHYTPNGVAQQDRSSVGFVFADPSEVKHVVGTDKAANTKFTIPAGADNHKVEATYTFRRDVLLMHMFPHMHLRGKSFRYTAIYEDGREEILLDVPRYDFNWQNGYALTEPKLMRKGARIRCTAHFDNSEGNFANPDPTVDVRWGDQTWEEMMIGYFNLATVEEMNLTESKAETRTRQFIEAARAGKTEITPEIEKLADTALTSEESLEAFARELQQVVPQLDRVCWTTASDGKLHVHMAAQKAELRSMIGGKASIDAAGMLLAKIAASDKTVVHGSIVETGAPDMRFLSRGVISSVHVPIGKAGRDGTLNFWSAEIEAFPPEAVKLLESVSRRVAPPDEETP
ncbi:MAG: redoxin domain-containing protein [Pirellulaceae bacterium]